MHAICATAVADGLLSPNPCQLTVPKPERLVKPIILEPDEVAAAAKSLEPQRFRAPALIAAWCGLRWGELGELRRKDISDNAEVITVGRGFEHDGGCHIDTTKSDKGRTVVVPPHIRADIKHHLDTYVAEDPEALLLTGKAVCGHLLPSTFRDAWHQGAERHWLSTGSAARSAALRRGYDGTHRGRADREHGPAGAFHRRRVAAVPGRGGWA